MGLLLQWRHLGVRLRGEEGAPPIVSGLNLDLHHGECVALTGPSGSGKTTACLAPFGLKNGRMEMTGVACFAGRPAGNQPTQSGAERVAFVLQEPINNFAPHLNIISQITDLKQLINEEEILEWCVELGLDDGSRLLRQYPHQCSGGELQRLALVAALAQEPSLLVADEPTAALDAASRDQWCRVVRRRCERGLAVLLVTHDPSVIAAVAHRQIPVGARPMPPANLPQEPVELPEPTRDVLLAVQLQATGSVQLPDGREGLTLAPGQSLTVTGPSGIGKSSLLRLVLGLPSPWKGQVQWRGKGLRVWPDASCARLEGDVGVVLQDARGGINPHRTALDGVSAGFQRRGNSWRVSRQHAAEELAAFGVPAECWPRAPSELSVGQAQRVALAQALACEPALLVLDEPTSAQDLGHRQRVVDRLLLAQRQQGTALLVATHDPELVTALGGPTLPLVPAGPAPTV